MIPERIASLSLISTAARIENTIVCSKMRKSNSIKIKAKELKRDSLKIFETESICCKLTEYPKSTIYLNSSSIPKALDVQIADVKSRLFSQEWLIQPDAEGNFPTNGDRFAAQEVQKRQDTEGFTRKGFMCQALAAGWHHKSAKQLKEMADKVGRERIMVVHGTVDQMITVPHGEILVRELGGEESGVKRVIFEGKGHALMMEERWAFTKLVGDFVEKTEGMEKS